ncbi:unnamed protein product [Polarella glacialis]|uniref:WW domain-containing protein n=1 Tax=Polarella glacialis TaxID=89957 RepID=A0A813HRU3_POLGL|nr:unnamed protein product [Polarella glacialis]
MAAGGDAPEAAEGAAASPDSAGAPPLLGPPGVSTEVLWKCLASVGLDAGSLGGSPRPPPASAAVAAAAAAIAAATKPTTTTTTTAVAAAVPAAAVPAAAVPAAAVAAAAAAAAAVAAAAVARKEAPVADSEPKVGAAASAPLSGGAVAGGHTPESIARLPPKLRARLVQRGILKEEDVRMALAVVLGGSGGSSPPSSSPPPSRFSPGTPPDPEAPAIPAAQTSGQWAAAAAAVKAPPQAPPQDSQAAWAKAAAAASNAWANAMLPALAKLPAGAVVKAAPPKAAPARAVYSSAPVLNKRPAEEEVGGDAKRQAPGTPPEEGSEAPPAMSPADARAAAVRADGGQVQAWLYKDGQVSQAGQQPSAQTPLLPSAQPAASVFSFKEPAASVFSFKEVAAPAPPLGAPPPPAGPPLPPGWVRVPSEDDFYFWNTNTNEVSWEHPAEKAEKLVAQKGGKGAGKKEEPKFTEEHRVLWTDLGKIIGSKGMNLKIIKASIGCIINVPKEGGKGGKGGKGKKGKDGKDKTHDTRHDWHNEKGKGDAKGKGKEGRGIGDGSAKLSDEMFGTVIISADDPHKARGGKRVLEIMLGYNRSVERALGELGVEVKMPSVEEMTGVGNPGKSGGKGKDKDGGIDPMDPSSYSDAPVGNWGSGMKKPGQKSSGGAEPRDSKTANAERC